MKRTLSYRRVSGRGQVDGDGFERQQEAIDRFCAANGLVVKAHFTDEAVSGTVEGTDRPGLVELLQYLDKSGIKSVTVERLDRLARDLMVQECIIMEFRKRGVKLFAADQGQMIDMADDGSDPTRTLIRQVMGALAQWEKSVIVKKLRVARERVKAEKGHCEGNKPFGFYPGESQTLAAMTMLREQGSSNSAIARFLNESEMTKRNGTEWDGDSVYEILTRRGGAERGQTMKF